MGVAINDLLFQCCGIFAARRASRQNNRNICSADGLLVMYLDSLSGQDLSRAGTRLVFRMGERNASLGITELRVTA